MPYLLLFWHKTVKVEVKNGEKWEQAEYAVHTLTIDTSGNKQLAALAFVELKSRE